MALTRVKGAVWDSDINNLAFNVIDYGADPTGATDSSSSVQAAVDAAVGTGINTRGAVFFPTGRYLLNSAIVKTAASFGFDITVFGEGPGVSEIIVDNAVGGFFFTVAHRASRIKFNDLTFSARRDNSGKAIRFVMPEGGNRHNRSFIGKDLEFQSENISSNYFDICIDLDGAWRPYLESCLATGPFGPAAINITSATAIYNLKNVYKPQLISCYGWSANIGLNMDITVDPGAEGFDVLDSTFVECNTCIKITTAGGVSQQEPGGFLRGVHVNGFNRGIQMDGKKYFQITDCLLFSSSTGGTYVDLEIDNCSLVTVKGCIFHFPTPAGVRNCIDIGADCSEIFVVANIFNNCADAIIVRSGVSNVTIEPCIFTNVSSNEVNDLSGVADFRTGTSKWLRKQSGATAGPDIIYFRDSSSPAALDVLATSEFRGRNSIGTEVGYAISRTQIITPTNGIEDGRFSIFVLKGGVTTDIMDVGPDRVDFNVPVGLQGFVVASLPAASPGGQMIYVTDEAGGAVPAFSDGVNWRRVTDRAIVS